VKGSVVMENQEFIENISKHIEINEKTQSLILQLLTGQSAYEKVRVSDDEKKRAAYALNMCTVSVSQIIDYGDLNILEQEYEAILNNLNLEQIPKDDALLHILRQLLDTITYFRIEAGEKAIIEKEYQQKMKNAIWSAVPNFGLIVAGGNPITMAVSLASQIGIGYMNYRRNKAEYGLEKERKEWELQKTAIEQFNGLRRELFDTAWRLADTYGFPDSYRLTEKQIAQYNKILMDQDEVRKYERLESIKDKFEAYPPFWYFIGNAANYIAGSQGLNLSSETRERYRKKAREYFEKFEDLNRFSILREDQLAASCALEHSDLLLLETKHDDTKIKELLDTAVCVSGNANDVLELCAITYLRIGCPDKAARILKILVNEDYNKTINAQILSSFYVHEHLKNRSENTFLADYELLASRVDADYLYPMPRSGENPEVLAREFSNKQKAVLKAKFKAVIAEYLDKYSIEWNKLTSIFDISADYPNSFFLDSEEAQAERRFQARRVYSDSTKKEYYQKRMAESDYELSILSILNEMCIRVFESSAFSNYELQQAVEYQIKLQIVDNRAKMNQLEASMNSGEFPMTGYLLSQTVRIRDIVGKAFNFIINYAIEQVDAANINDLTFLEGNLRTFCNANGLVAPEIAINRKNNSAEMFGKKAEPFEAQLFGHQAVIEKKNADFMRDMVSFAKEKINVMELRNDDTAIYFADSPEFMGYFFNVAFQEHPDIKRHALMVLHDNTKRKHDLVFTTDGIVSVIKEKVKNITPYNEVKRKGDAIVLYRNEAILTKDYKVTFLDINSFYDVIRQLGAKFVRTPENKTVYIEGIVTVEILNRWFKEQPESMEDGVKKVYAIPSPDIMKSFGFHCEEEIDKDHNLLQFFYNDKTRDIMGLRIVQFDGIDSNFQSILLEHDGIIRC